MALAFWTTPRSYAFDEIVNETILNDDHRDNLLAIPHPYDYDTTIATASNTAAESTLYSKTITGGAMGVNGCLELLLNGILLHNTSNTFLVKVKFGGTTWLTNADGGNPMSAGASYVPWEMRVTLANRAATNSQFITATLAVWGPSLIAGATGYGNFNGQPSGMYGGIMGVHNLTVNTATDQTLAVTVQWGAASANNMLERHLAHLLLGKN